MIKLSRLISEQSVTVKNETKPIVETINPNRIKDLLNENQIIKVENGFSVSGDHQYIDFHLSNGVVIKIGGFSDDDIIHVEVS